MQCLPHAGYVGTWLSMLHVWRRSIAECREEWTILLESDAVLPPRFDSLLTRYRTTFANSDVVWLDERAGRDAGASGCCTVAVAYRGSVLSRLVAHFDPQNARAYWNGYERNVKPTVDHKDCLTDWYLGNVAAHLKLRCARRGLVHHPTSAYEIALLG